jgi:hypothetical protein
MGPFCGWDDGHWKQSDRIFTFVTCLSTFCHPFPSISACDLPNTPPLEPANITFRSVEGLARPRCLTPGKSLLCQVNFVLLDDSFGTQGGDSAEARAGIGTSRSVF